MFTAQVYMNRFTGIRDRDTVAPGYKGPLYSGSLAIVDAKYCTLGVNHTKAGLAIVDNWL